MMYSSHAWFSQACKVVGGEVEGQVASQVLRAAGQALGTSVKNVMSS